MLRILLLLVAFFNIAHPAFAGGRVALVIGNGAYQNTPALENPSHDAELIASSLRNVGFEVIDVVDGDRKTMLDALGRFGRTAEGADVALFFYAGHGLEVAGRNWILPVNADIAATSDLPVSAMKVDDVLEVMELSGAGIRLVILDACRNNPLPRSISRSTSRGLAKIDASAAGTMVIFAAAPGEVALDGTGGNSPFSSALASHIGDTGLEVRQMIGRVRKDVMAATGSKQVPWVNEAIVGDFYLAGAQANGGGNAPTAPAATPSEIPGADLSIELKFWDSVKDSANAQLLGIYLQKYPNGAFADLAKAMIATLDKPAAGRGPPPGSGGQTDVASLVDRMEDETRRIVTRMNRALSGSIEEEIAAIGLYYADSVEFHGKRFNRDEIIADKRKVFSRWPERQYDAPENEMLIDCQPSQNYCDARYMVYWYVNSPERAKSVTGISRGSLRLDFGSGLPRVIYEASENVETRQK